MSHQRNPNYNLIRIVATFAVVVTHHGLNLRAASDSAPSDLVAAILYGTTRWCVPLFVMLSGALLLHAGNAQQFAAFYRRRLSRLAIPTAFWSVVYALIAVFPLTRESLHDLAIRLACGQPADHLWFLFMLLGLYLTTPFLADLFTRFPLRATGAAGLTLLSFSAIDTTFAFLVSTGGRRSFTFLLSWTPYVGYFLLGATLAKLVISLQRTGIRRALQIALAISVALGLMLHLALPAGTPNRAMLLASYFNPLTIVQSLLIFALLLSCHLPSPSSRWACRAASLGDLTLGVYLIHPLFYQVWQHPLEVAQRHTAVAVAIALATALIVTALCMLLTAGLKRLPFLRHAV